MLRDLCQNVVGKDLKGSCEQVLQSANHCPFAASAVGSALEFIHWSSCLSILEAIRLVFPLTAKATEVDVANQVEEGLSRGFRCFKMKVGRNLRNDVLSSQFVLKEFISHNYTMRFDANQAYSLDQAVSFCRCLEKIRSPGLLWLEQPLRRDDWAGMQSLCEASSVPLILDEPIYTETDIARAKSVGCHGVKLKLFKHPGMNACLQLARVARESGLAVVLGNGIASDIGNLAEALIIASAPGLFVEGAECNGFDKLVENVAYPQLGVSGLGSLVWTGCRSLNLDDVLKALRGKSLQIEYFS